VTLATSTVRALGALSAGLLTLGMLSACTPTPEPDPKPTKTALFASDKEAFKAAEETYRAYLSAYNSIDLSSRDALEVTRKYVTGPYAASEREAISELQAEKLTRTGESVLIAFLGEAYERPDRIRARVCSDVSGTDLLDTDGTSVVPDTRPDRYALEVLFEITGTRILIAEANAVEDSSCTSASS